MQSRMNPYTLLKLWEPFAESNGNHPMHILEVAGESGCWPGTIYKARSLGYLKFTRRAYFKPTAKMKKEIEAIHDRQRQSFRVVS